MERSFIYLMMVVVGVLVALAILTVRKILRKNKNIKDALFQLGLGYKKHFDGQSPQELKFKLKKHKLIFNRFNYGLSVLDFYKKQQAIEELFGVEIVEFQRTNQFQVVGKLGDFNSPIQKTIKERSDVLICFDGVKKHYFEESRSAFLFGLSGTGKTHLLENCVLKQLRKMDSEIHIITSKKSDFEAAYSYHNPQDLQKFKEILRVTEELRLGWEEAGIRNKKHIVFVFDEVQECNDDKEITTVIKSWIRVGRSQNIWVILASQSGTVASLRNIEINLVPIKIAVRFTESVAFAETIFTPELAFKSHHIKQPFGFGYVKTPSYVGGKVRFYYEP